MILAVKCTPDRNMLSAISNVGLEAVELHLSSEFLKDASYIIELCKDFPLRYALHAPNDGSSIFEIAELTKRISAEIVVFHNNYWEDEWAGIIEQFKGASVRLCVENTYSVHEPVKFIRRYGMGRCLDLEHLQISCGGVYEEAFIPIIKEASHIHLSGYRHGTSLWHTHIHHSPEHGMYMLGLLEKAGYAGFVVSEAKVSLQTYSEFTMLRQFYDNWRKMSSK